MVHYYHLNYNILNTSNYYSMLIFCTRNVDEITFNLIYDTLHYDIPMDISTEISALQTLEWVEYLTGKSTRTCFRSLEINKKF